MPRHVAARSHRRQPALGSGDSVYTRPGRTTKVHGQYFHDTAGCAMGCLSRHACKRPARAPAKVTALREPCSRKVITQPLAARASPAHPIQRIKTLPQFVVYLKSNWPQITRTPWPENDAALHHYIVGWPQCGMSTAARVSFATSGSRPSCPPLRSKATRREW